MRTLTMLFCLVLSSTVLASDNFQMKYLYPQSLAVISDSPLPPPVYEAQKRKCLIHISYFAKKNPSKRTLVWSETGTIVNPGIIVTTSHGLDIARNAIEEIVRKEGGSMNDFDLKFQGLINYKDKIADFDLKLVAQGEDKSTMDLAVFQINVETFRLAMAADDNSIVTPENPYKILIENENPEDAQIGQKVYLSGITPIYKSIIPYTGELGALLTFLDYTFSCTVIQQPVGMEANQRGVKRFYVLRGQSTYGFSGGPVHNENGRWIGIFTDLDRSGNFLVVLSSRDIYDFLQKHKILK